MKQALLRGVCALNIETMSVFGQQGQGTENLPAFGKPSTHSMDPLPFAPKEDEAKLRPSPLKSNMTPLKESTWVNHQQGRSYSPERYTGIPPPSGRYSATPVDRSTAAPNVRHGSEYAALHQLPPPVPSLLRRPNPGSLHVADQHPASNVYAPPSIDHVENHHHPMQPLTATRPRSPAHVAGHNMKQGATTVQQHRPNSQHRGGKVIRPAVGQAQQGPIGMVTLRGDATRSRTLRSKGT